MLVISIIHKNLAEKKIQRDDFFQFGDRVYSLYVLVSIKSCRISKKIDFKRFYKWKTFGIKFSVIISKKAGLCITLTKSTYQFSAPWLNCGGGGGNNTEN